MTIDGFLTFVGLVLALLALASDATRQRLLLHRRSLGLATAVALPAVLYLQFFDVLARPCLAQAACGGLILGGRGRPGADDVAYIVVLAWLVFIAWRLWRRRLRPRHLPQLSGLLTALAEERRYSELCRIAGPELDMVADVASGGIERASAGEVEAAQAIQRLMHQREDLVRFIALERPPLAVGMMRRRHTLVFDFADEVLTVLVSTPGSPLYAEVAANQNTAGPGYHYPEHNTYLHFLLADATTARDLGAWQPVMEAVIDRLREARASGYAAFLNGPVGRFADVGRWKDQTFVGIRFLDLMVSAALVQGIRDHMWLFYTPHVLTPLLDLHDESQPGVNLLDETPTRGGWIIQQLFSMQLRWIGSVDRLPEVSPHLALEAVRPTSEPANIPKSAILAVKDCLEQVLVAREVPERFRHMIADMVFRTLRGLPATGPRAGFRAALVATLVEPDHHSEPYLIGLWAAIDDCDPNLRSGIADLVQALQAVYPAPPPRP